MKYKIIQLFIFIIIILPAFAQDNKKKEDTQKIEILSDNLRNKINDYINSEDKNQLFYLLSDLNDFSQTEKFEILKWGIQKESVFLRRTLIEFLLKNSNLISKEDDSTVYNLWIKLVKAEFEYFKNLERYNQKDVIPIKNSIKTAGKIKEKELFYDIIVFIAFPLYEVRTETFKSLSQLKDDRMLPILINLVESSNPIEKTYALDAFSYIKDERIVSILIKALKDENKSVRYYAIKTLEKMQRTEAIPYFIKIVQSDINNEIRIKAIEVLGNYSASSAFSTLLKTISDEDHEVRKAAIAAVLKFKNDNAGYYISEQLKDEENDELKLLEIKALLYLKTSGGARGLTKIINEESNNNIKIWATYTAGQLQENRVFSSLLNNLNSKENLIKIETAYALGKYENKKAADNLIAMLKDESINYDVQSAVLHALKNINYDSTLPILFDLSEKHSNKILKIQIKEVIAYMLEKRY
ncbi:MAG: HEAT repeat domain-containing protein [Spirochaetia bacterium]|nr:HEAT repeat domain-containing protein [Spirochaetia bacterium]